MARFEIRISGKELREHIAAKALLRRSGLSLTDAARIALERERERRAEEKARNVAFSEALDVYLHEHRHLRARTLSDYRYQGRRLAAAAPDFCRARLRTLSAEDCARALDAAFPRARQRKKGLALLCAVFNFAMRKRWAEENPAKAVPTPRISEKEIAALAPEEIEALKKAAEAQGGPRALAALGLMLYAGVRPAEMLRLTTADVDLEERVVCIASRCSKTGGPRHVSVAPPLYRILKNLLQAEEARGNGAAGTRIAPPDWERKWLKIRKACGWGLGEGEKRWPQDALRHTFASYHLKRFRDIGKLQLEMGHASPRLLFSRYLNMRGISRADAARFWA